MFKPNFKEWYKQQVDWTVILIIGIMLFFAIRGLVDYIQLNSNPAYTKGILTGIHKGSKGSRYWGLGFYAGENWIKSSAPLGDCKACVIGDTIFIKYQLDDPHKNIMSKMPLEPLSRSSN